MIFLVLGGALEVAISYQCPSRAIASVSSSMFSPGSCSQVPQNACNSTGELCKETPPLGWPWGEFEAWGTRRGSLLMVWTFLEFFPSPGELVTMRKTMPLLQCVTPVRGSSSSFSAVSNLSQQTRHGRSAIMLQIMKSF